MPMSSYRVITKTWTRVAKLKAIRKMDHVVPVKRRHETMGYSSSVIWVRGFNLLAPELFF